MNVVWGGAASIVTLCMLRVVQVMMAERDGAWWAIECVRWSIILTLVIWLTTQLRRMGDQLADHRERMAKIDNEAMWARLELDVKDFREYAEKL